MLVMQIGAWINSASRRLKRANLQFGHGASSAQAEACWIAANACRLTPRHIHVHSTRRMSDRNYARAELILRERIWSRKPLAYILKEAWLGPHRFYVDERVIVPRSLIFGLLLERLKPWITDPEALLHGLDLCTGSGCLAILMAKQFKKMRVDAVDISPDALAVATINRSRTKLQHRLRLIQSDLFRDLPRRRYDLIISNPPYVTSASMRRLPAEYRHEPSLALQGGHDGLEVVRRIISDCPQFLSKNGYLVLEIGRNRRRFETAFPGLSAFWLDTPGESDLVAMIEAQELRRFSKNLQ